MGRWVRQAGFLLVRKHGVVTWVSLYRRACRLDTKPYDLLWKGAAMHQVITTAHNLDLWS